MGKPILALVNFFKEARGKRVVNLEDILFEDSPHNGFPPDHHQDFLPDHVYSVKWPHQPTDQSFSTEGLFDAKILCVGESMDDLVHEAKGIGQKISAQDIKNFTEKSEQEAKIETESKLDEEKSKKPSEDGQGARRSSRSLKKRKGKHNSPRPHPGPISSRKKKSSFEDEARKERGRDFVLDNYSDPCCSSMDQGSSGAAKSAKDRVLSKKSDKKVMEGDTEEEEGTDATDPCYVTSDGETENKRDLSKEKEDLYLKRIYTLHDDMKALKREQLNLREQLSVAQACTESLEIENKRLLALNLSMQERLFNSNSSELIVHTESIKNVTPREIHTPESKESSSAGLLSSRKDPLSSLSGGRVKRQLDQYYEEKISPSNPDKRLSLPNKNSSPSLSDGSGKRKLDRDFEKGNSFSNPDEGIPKKEKKKKLTNEGKVASNEVLAEMIYQAITNSATPLQIDGAGQCHVGNGVYISLSLFDEKLKKAKVSPGVALRDATSNLYSEAELAVRSLEGGTPVKKDKDGNRIKKKKMTPAKRESLLAVYRAKERATSGKHDKDYLDLVVEKKGKSVLREKMKEAAKSIRKQAESKAASASTVPSAVKVASNSSKPNLCSPPKKNKKDKADKEDKEGKKDKEDKEGKKDKEDNEEKKRVKEVTSSGSSSGDESADSRTSYLTDY